MAYDHEKDKGKQTVAYDHFDLIFILREGDDVSGLEAVLPVAGH